MFTSNTSHAPSDPDDVIVTIFTGTCVGIIIVLNLILNSLTLVVLHRMRQINPITRLFLSSMTVTDLCTIGYFTPAFASTILNEWPFSDQVCTGVAFISICTSILYYTHLPLVNFERFIAVTRPFKYLTVLSVFRARATVVCIWCIAIFFTVLRGMLPHKIAYHPHLHTCILGSETGLDIVGVIYTTLLFFLPIVISVYFFVRLYCVAVYHARQIDTHERQVNGGIDRDSEMKISVTFFIMTVSLILCTTPKTIVYFYDFSTGEELNAWYVSFAVILSALNTILNVFIYYWRTAAFRKTLKDMFCQ